MLTCNNNSFLCTINKSSDSATAPIASSYFFWVRLRLEVVSKKYMGSSNSLSGLGLSYGDLSGKKEPLDVCSSTFLLCFLLLNWTNNKVHVAHW